MYFEIRTFFGLNFNRNHIIRCMTLNVFGLSLFCVANHSVIWLSWKKKISHSESAPNKFLMTNGEQQQISMQMASEKASFWYTEHQRKHGKSALDAISLFEKLGMTILWVPQIKLTIDLFVVRLCCGNFHKRERREEKNGEIKCTLLHHQSQNDCHFNLTLEFLFLFYSSQTCWVRAKDTFFFRMSTEQSCEKAISYHQIPYWSIFIVHMKIITKWRKFIVNDILCAL